MPVDLAFYDKLSKELEPRSVTLVAVSKTKPQKDILELYHHGHRDFGENYVQELAEKQALLPADIRWHFIGHLQTNKVKNIAPYISLVHGVDSLKLLKEINRQAERNNRVIDCLLQVYIAQEETKFGLSFEEAEQLLADTEFSRLKNICVKGFMGMATLTGNVALIRNEFKSLKTFFTKINKKDSNNPYHVLSMGMTSDYKIALEEGSTMVRIGSALFGERNNL